MPRQKYEREIVDILERMDRQNRPATERRRQPEPSRPVKPLHSVLATAPGWSSRAWVALVVGLPLLGVLLVNVAPPLAALLVLIGIVLLLSPAIQALIGLISRGKQPLWRGRVVELPNRGGGFGLRWRYWLWAWRQGWARWRGGRR